MRNIILLEEAACDIERARVFYETIDWELGNYFVDSTLSDLERLALFHGIHPRHFGLHRMLESSFQWGIYYEETKSET